MFTVRVVSESNGKAVSGVEVAVHFSGLLSGYLKESTDGSGEADFDHDPGSATVYVRGSEVYSGRLEGRTTVYI
jgi:hypothetical protein